MTKLQSCGCDYLTPRLKFVEVCVSGILCDSQTFMVSPTEVDTADREVYSGGSYDDLS